MFYPCHIVIAIILCYSKLLPCEFVHIFVIIMPYYKHTHTHTQQWKVAFTLSVTLPLQSRRSELFARKHEFFMFLFLESNKVTITQDTDFSSVSIPRLFILLYTRLWLYKWEHMDFTLVGPVNKNMVIYTYFNIEIYSISVVSWGVYLYVFSMVTSTTCSMSV